jgi:hypothetical protein
MTRAAAWIAAGLVAVTAGCASMRASRARSEYLKTQLDALHYTKPIEEVWPEVQRLLADKGYPLAGADAKAVGQKEMNWAQRLLSPAKETHHGDPGSLLQFLGVVARDREAEERAQSLETGWRSRQNRYRADGLKEGTGCRVVLTAIDLDETEHRDGSRHRDLELELELARRVDREAADRIEVGLAAPGASKG